MNTCISLIPSEVSDMEVKDKPNHESLLHRVYFAAKDGMAIAVTHLLLDEVSSNEEANEVVNMFIDEEDGERCTPLIVAAREGRYKVVKTLISNFKVDLEREGIVKFDGFLIEGASALWCAAGAGHLNVVKLLVKAGANVNHPTSTNSTPVRAACFEGRLDIVSFLTENKADINIANKYNNTCLMIASYKGHTTVVMYLLENGANPNERANCGATALHFAAECGHYLIVLELLWHGADFRSTNEAGMTPLKLAANRTQTCVFDSLLNWKGVTIEEQIEALELLGASFANDKDNYSIESAYQYLEAAMNLRYSDPNNIIKKNLITPVPAYENCVETQSPEELQRIRYNANALHMESLTIRERILGEQNSELPHPIVFRGAVFADNARFDRCIELWLHAVNLRQKNHVPLVKDLLRLAQVFSQMLYVGVQVSYKHVLEVLLAAVVELKRNKTRIITPAPKDDPDNLLEELETNIMTTLYLLTIFTNMLTKWDCDEREEFAISQLVYKLNRMDLRLRDGQTLLHLACNAETPVDDFHINDICKYPNSETVCLLIYSGGDVNAIDNNGNTPLHVIVKYHKSISDFATLQMIILKLSSSGAHIDSVNNDGDTALDLTATGVAEIILKTQLKLSLKCIAAKAVISHRLKYSGNVPQELTTFIEMHGPRNKKLKKHY